MATIFCNTFQSHSETPVYMIMITFRLASYSLTDMAQLPWRWAESTVKPRNILRHRSKYYFNDYYYIRRALRLFSDRQNIEIFNLIYFD